MALRAERALACDVLIASENDRFAIHMRGSV